MESFSIHHLFVLLVMLIMALTPLAVVGFVVWYVRRNQKSLPASTARDVRIPTAVRKRPRGP